MAKADEELEFISVSPDDNNDDGGNMSQSYGVQSATSRGGYDNVIGHWVLNQSKVSPRYPPLFEIFCSTAIY